MHKRSKSSQLQGMEEGGGILSANSERVGEVSGSNRNTSSDALNMALLIMLYAMQGVPLGLSLGSVPFILKSRASYTGVGVFSLAGYPYSMKLLWSPIVDTVYSARIGWRKSWVLPMQIASGLLMLLSAKTADHWESESILIAIWRRGKDDLPNVDIITAEFRRKWNFAYNTIFGISIESLANIRSITMLFFVFILLAATQDIAVDGWALTLLSRRNLGHASTCQSVGITSGYFLSFTIFLALNDPAFCNSYLRSAPKPKGILTLSKYFYFWGWFYIISTFLLLRKSETSHQNMQNFSNSVDFPGNGSGQERSDRQTDLSKPLEIEDEKQGKAVHETLGRSVHGLVDPNSGGPGKRLGHSSSNDRVAAKTQRMGVKHMYLRLWAVVTLPNIRLLTSVLLISKLGSVTAETVGVFKLMEKGVTREMVSLVVLIEFPLELIFAVFAGRWASKGRPFTPWLMSYYLRLGMAAVSTLLVALFPVGATLRSAPIFYFLIIVSGVATSFASTIMFVAQGTFFSRISDSSMGGTYLTLLNTIANFGSAWPKFFVFILLDMLTVQQCVGAKVVDESVYLSCSAKSGLNGRSSCTEAGGKCITTVDGFYPLSFGAVILGALIGKLCSRNLRVLEKSKEAAWRA